MPASSKPSESIKPLSTQLPPQTLRTRFLQVKVQQKLRNRDAATALNVSEGEALAACVGFEAIRLKS